MSTNIGKPGCASPDYVYGYGVGDWQRWEGHNPEGFRECIEVIKMYNAMGDDSDFIKDTTGLAVTSAVFDICHALRWLECTEFEFEHESFDELMSLYSSLDYKPGMFASHVPDSEEEGGAYNVLVGLLSDEGLTDVEYLIDMGYVAIGLRERDTRYTDASEFECTTDFELYYAALTDVQHLILSGETELVDRMLSDDFNGLTLSEEYEFRLEAYRVVNVNEEIPDGEWSKLTDELERGYQVRCMQLAKSNGLPIVYSLDGMSSQYGNVFTVQGVTL